MKILVFKYNNGGYYRYLGENGTNIIHKTNNPLKAYDYSDDIEPNIEAIPSYEGGGKLVSIDVSLS